MSFSSIKKHKFTAAAVLFMSAVGGDSLHAAGSIPSWITLYNLARAPQGEVGLAVLRQPGKADLYNCQKGRYLGAPDDVSQVLDYFRTCSLMTTGSSVEFGALYGTTVKNYVGQPVSRLILNSSGIARWAGDEVDTTSSAFSVDLYPGAIPRDSVISWVSTNIFQKGLDDPKITSIRETYVLVGQAPTDAAPIEN